MGCGCNAGAESTPAVEAQYEVTTPDGRTIVVQGEAQAKIEATMTGGSYRKR